MESSDDRDRRMKAIALEVEQRLKADHSTYATQDRWPWVLQDGGTHFVCACRNCSVNSCPIDADQNAAANVGLWFLRGIDDFRVKVDGAGKPSRSLRYTAIARFVDVADAEPPYWEASTEAASARRRTAAKALDEEEESGEEAGAGTWLFRDPSGNLPLPFRANRWYEPKCFWGAVANFAASGIKAANASHWAELID